VVPIGRFDRGKWVNTSPPGTRTCARAGRDAFVIRENSSDEIVGCTRYFNVDAATARLEIGLYLVCEARPARPDQHRVQAAAADACLRGAALHRGGIRTHWFNHASRVAIERLGAKQDGVLRNHQLLADGSKRDTVVFSIIDGEWPAVRQHLKFQLERPR
jgi:RimJ/RimL family protein N-acetyltransferase